MLRDKRILEHSRIWVINGLENVLLVLENDHVFELKPLFDLFLFFANSFRWVTLHKDSLDIRSFIRVVVAPYLVGVFDTLHFFSQNAKTFHSFVQREEIFLKIFIGARPILQRIEMHICCSIPRFDPELDRAN